MKELNLEQLDDIDITDMKNKQKSLFKNCIFNIIKTFSSLAFPIITFAYVARILGDIGIGRVNFAKSIVSYFSMIAMLGMNYYGTREAAKLRDDRIRFSGFVKEMLVINTCTTALAYLLLFLAIRFVPRLYDYKTLLLVYSVSIVLNGMGMEWLYQAVEEYNYIAIRSMVFQIIALVAMFFLIKDSGDDVTYATIMLFATSGSYVLNFVNARKYVAFGTKHHYNIKKHIKPILWLFAMVVSIELYTVLDSTMLGFLCGDAAVGRYTAAVKVNKMVNSMITSIGVVLIPRLAYYIKHRQNEIITGLVNKVYNYMFMLAIPAFLGLLCLSDEIIRLFSGSGFGTASHTMRILTPIVLIIPFSIITNMQIFIPMCKEKLILQSTMVGAVTNFLLNMLLIPRYAENGAAVATVIAEGIVTIVCLRNIGKFYDRKQIFNHYVQYWIAALPILLIVRLIDLIPIHYGIRMSISILVSAVCYFGILFLLGNSYFVELITVLCQKSHLPYKIRRK